MQPQRVISILLLLFSFTVTQTRPLQEQLIRALFGCLAVRGVDVYRTLYEYNLDPASQYAFYNYQWETLNPIIYPAAYFVPESAQHVRDIVRCARRLGIPIVPKGGGHSYEKYSLIYAEDSGQDTVVVDLQRLDHVEVHPTAGQAVVGAGALLGKVAWILYNGYELTTPHGTCPTVGIAGLALGGGYGAMSRLYGLTTDAILELEIVTADGELLTVSRDSYPDLFWALRGCGAGSFGIVTKFRLRTFAAPKQLVFGTARYGLDEYTSVFMAWQRFLLSNPPNEVHFKLGASSSQVIVEIYEVQLRQGETEVEAGLARIRGYFETFFPTPGTGAPVRYDVYDEYPEFMMASMFARDYGLTSPDQLPTLNRHSHTQRHFESKSFYVTQELTQEDVQKVRDALLHTGAVPRGTIADFHATGGAINTPDEAQLEESSFTHRNQTLFIVQAFYFGAPDAIPEEEARALRWVDEFFELGKSAMHSTESYQNYADKDLLEGGEYLHRYYGHALDRLMEIKQRYDPSNYFRGPQSIPLPSTNTNA